MKTIVAIIVLSAFVIVAMFLGGYFKPGSIPVNLTKNTQTTSEKTIPAKLELVAKVEEYEYSTSYGQFVFKKVSESKFVVEYPEKIGNLTSCSYSQDVHGVNFIFVSFMKSDKFPGVNFIGSSFIFEGKHFYPFYNKNDIVLEFEWVPR